MRSPSRYYPAFDKPPFCLAVAGATAIPGPILIDLMTRLDLTESANRSVLNRMVSRGSLALSRTGRVGVYRLAGHLLANFERIRGGGQPPSWDGRLHALIYDTSETRRTARERFRAAAMRVGYRSLRPGVLVSPSDQSSALAEQIHELGVMPGFLDADVDTARVIANRAWSLGRVREEGERLCEHLEAAVPELSGLGAESAFRHLHGLIRPVIAWTVELGGLPAELMPEHWPGSRVHQRLADIHGVLLPSASAFAEEVIRTSPYLELVEWR